MEIIFISANVHQFNIAKGVAHVQVCSRSFYLLFHFFLAGQGSGEVIKLICASGWFVLPVGLYFRFVCASGLFVLPVGLYFRLVCASDWFVRMVNNNCTPNTNSYV